MLVMNLTYSEIPLLGIEKFKDHGKFQENGTPGGNGEERWKDYHNQCNRMCGWRCRSCEVW